MLENGPLTCWRMGPPTCWHMRHAGGLFARPGTQFFSQNVDRDFHTLICITANPVRHGSTLTVYILFKNVPFTSAQTPADGQNEPERLEQQAE